jgi:hypothetical protein
VIIASQGMMGEVVSIKGYENFARILRRNNVIETIKKQTQPFANGSTII